MKNVKLETFGSWRVPLPTSQLLMLYVKNIIIRLGHLTRVCSVSWPLNRIKGGGYLVLLLTFHFSLVNFHVHGLVSMRI